MKRLISISTIIFLITSGINVFGEKKICPSSKEVLEFLQTRPNSDYVEVHKIGSHKAENTHYHIFSGTTVGDTYRVIIFNNEGNYVGSYAHGLYEPKKYNPGTKEICCYSKKTKRWENITIGGNGPWARYCHTAALFPKPPYTKPQVMRLHYTSAYIKPVNSKETRTWTLDEYNLEVKAKLVEVIREWVYLENIEQDFVYRVEKNVLSSEDRNYVKNNN